MRLVRGPWRKEAWSIGHRATNKEPQFRIIPVQGARYKVHGEKLHTIHVLPVPYTLYPVPQLLATTKFTAARSA